MPDIYGNEPQRPLGGAANAGISQTGLLDAIQAALGGPGTGLPQRDEAGGAIRAPKMRTERPPNPMQDEDVQDMIEALRILGYDMENMLGQTSEQRMMRGMNQASRELGQHPGPMSGLGDISQELRGGLLKSAATQRPPLERDRSSAKGIRAQGAGSWPPSPRLK